MTIYERLGIKTFINAAGTYTVIGGSRMSEKTLKDMADAARSHVEIRELQKIVHKKLAELTNNESAYVSNGAACGIYLTIAACISLKENKPFNYIAKERIQELEVVTNRAHRNPYDRGIEDLGVKLIEIGYPNIILPTSEEELRQSINENTVAIFYVAGEKGSWVPEGSLSFNKTLKIAKEKNIPLIVDAAAQLPPKENLWKFTQTGADIVLFSGGKDLCGPQSSGLIVGSKKIIDLITDVGFPNYSIGRMLKVGREEIAGLYSAVEQYVKHDSHERLKWCEKQIHLLKSKLETSRLFSVKRCFPNEAGQPIPRAFIQIKDFSVISTDKLIDLLFKGEPSIYVTYEKQEGVFINPMTLKDNETEIIYEKLIKIEKNILDK